MQDDLRVRKAAAEAAAAREQIAEGGSRSGNGERRADNTEAVQDSQQAVHDLYKDRIPKEQAEKIERLDKVILTPDA